MIKSLKTRARPDNLKNQVRAGGQSLARRIYLASVVIVIGSVIWMFIGPLVVLDADGLVMRERFVAAPEFRSTVTKILIKPGDHVRAGEKVAQVESSEAIEKMADLATRIATFAAREANLNSRVIAIQTLLPIARARKERAQKQLDETQALAERQLATNSRLSETTRDLFQAKKEEAELVAETQAIAEENTTLHNAHLDLNELLSAIRRLYNDGAIIAPKDGVVGAKIANVGEGLGRGDPVLEIYEGANYVLGYMPTSRLFQTRVGDDVVVIDGLRRSRGRIERIEGLANAAPPEFQSAFRSVERRQLLRVAFTECTADFPIYGKVYVAGRFTPANLWSLIRTPLTLAAYNGEAESCSASHNQIASRDAITP